MARGWACGIDQLATSTTHLISPMKNNKNQIQQGDVLLRRINSLPVGCKKLETLTLAQGEHTGHHHSFDSDGGVALMEAPDKRVFVVNSGDKPAPLTHQEHKPVMVPPGIHEFGQVCEKNWFTEMVAAVRD